MKKSRNRNYRNVFFDPTLIDSDRYYVILKGIVCYVDEIVANTALPLPPEAGRYKLEHINGDMLDNRIDNLVWVKLLAPIPVSGQYLSGDYLIDEKGIIYDDGHEMQLYGHTYDKQTDRIVIVSPYFYNRYTHDYILVKDVLENAKGYVSGDKDSLSKPVILHIDHDWMNFAKDNLRWVEESSQEYQDYYKDKVKSMLEAETRANKSKHLLDSF